jgi:ubiquinone/menaquinone biosynthesis C-methylase UbiE
MAVLDCGCGEATITMGLAEVVHDGRVVADGRQLPFHDAVFDAVLCHSVLEVLDVPTRTVAELRCVTKPGGVVGVASVDYGGIITWR